MNGHERFNADPTGRFPDGFLRSIRNVGLGERNTGSGSNLNADEIVEFLFNNKHLIQPTLDYILSLYDVDVEMARAYRSRLGWGIAERALGIHLKR